MSFCTKTFLLAFNDFKMFRIDLRYDHWYIWCPAVCAVIGYNRSFCLCILFLDLFDFFFCHIYSTKYKVNIFADILYFIYIFNDNFFHCFRHRSLHFPTSTNSFFVCLPCTSWACCNYNNLKPWMILQKGDKSLSYHSCTTKDTYT